jgi:hypothetical protein
VTRCCSPSSRAIRSERSAEKNFRAATPRPVHPRSWAHAVRPRHCPQAAFELPISTDVLFVDKSARHAQGYPTSFPQGRRVRSEVGEVPLQDKGFGLVANILKKLVDRLSLRRYVHADLGTTRIREAPNSSERGADRLSGAGSPDPKPSGMVTGGQYRSCGAGLVFGRVAGPPEPVPQGAGEPGEGEPERGAPRSTELETAKGYSGLPRVSGSFSQWLP